MMIKFLSCEEFEKDLKHLGKKYPSIETDFAFVKKKLKEEQVPFYVERINNL
jgi:hypothetical protein